MLPVRVLVVDDSVVVRKLLCEALASSSEVEVAGTASNGAIALAKIPQVNPDLVTLDIEMPGMNGIQALVEIRRRYPKLPVIMCSTLSERGAAVTLEALSLGASDYVTKPTNSASLAGAMEQLSGDLISKIVSLVRGHDPVALPSAVAPAAKAAGARRLAVFHSGPHYQKVSVVAIGCSTGGPNALAEVIPKLPGNLAVPVVVVQHMPPLFTKLLAERLDCRSELSVHEAEPDVTLRAGQVWIARGDYHLALTRRGPEVVLQLNQDPPENSCRPAVDVMFRSVAKAYGADVLGVVLTGMGLDGARGAQCIRDAGGAVVVQNEASSVVWGMPGAVVQVGAADKICPLEEIGLEIVRRVASGDRDTLLARGAAKI